MTTYASIMKNLLLFLLLSCCTFRNNVVVLASPKSKLDFSYLHRVKSTMLGDAIQQNIISLLNDDDDDETNKDDDITPNKKNSVVDIDVSASMIGKDLKDLVSSLENSFPAPVSIQLTARANQWTMVDATVLLQSIVETMSGSTENIEPEDNDADVLLPSVESVKTDTEIVDVNNETAIDSNETVIDSNETVVDSNETVLGSNKTVGLDDNQTAATTTTTTEDDSSASFNLSVHSLDLGWNNFGQGSKSRQSKAFLKSLQKIVESKRCPQTLRFPVCGLGPGACRAIGKGMISRYEQTKGEAASTGDVPPLSLYLTSNDAIGDAGTAALAAAIRTVADAKRKSDDSSIVLDVLDLSGCAVGDTGAEALAIALEKHPVRHLDLSNNQITDEGALVLGQALEKMDSGKQLSLDLSHNKDIGNAGAKAIAGAIEKGVLCNIIMRGCHIQADGAACFARALRHVSQNSKVNPPLRIDLSGNPLGILRKKSKSGGGKYSATALKSKATATTSAYMNLIGKTVSKGLKDLGIADMPDTLESDDEEDDKMNSGDEDDDDPSKIKCGALAFASAFIEDEDDEYQIKAEDTKRTKSDLCKIDFGLRQCSFDTKATEALAAVRQEAKSLYNMDLVMDLRMHNVLEDEMIAALRGDTEFESNLAEMAERHMDAMEALRAARQRSLQAARAAAARIREERAMEASWDAPAGFDSDAWDSDADYDDPQESDGFF